MLAVYQDKKTPNPGHFYDDFCKTFGKTLDRMNRGNREEGSNERRRQITTISDLGYSD